jgi:hypothetical protein
MKLKIPKTKNATCQENRSVNALTMIRPTNPPIAVPPTYTPITLPMLRGEISSFRYVIAMAGNPAKLTPSNSLKMRSNGKLWLKADKIVSKDVRKRDTLIIPFRPHALEKTETNNMLTAIVIVAKEMIQLAVDGET